MHERKHRRSGFSLVEILVALVIMSALLTIILIPLRLGFDSFHVGQARSNNQIVVQSTLSDIEKDLRGAVYVFPNRTMPGITDQTPFSTTTVAQPPYTRAKSTTVNGKFATNACPFSLGNADLWSNPARIDMIPAARDGSGNVIQPLQLGPNIVTYYARRQFVNSVYDPIDNPIVLYRAEYPLANTSADITDIHAASSCGTGKDFRWLGHNVYGEADLEELPGVTETLATPRGLSLVASRAFRAGGNGFPTTGTISGVDTEAPFKPDSSFTCLDTNGDGKIDRVNISLAIVNYDTSGNASIRNGQPSGQALRGDRIVLLPNIR